MAKQLKDILKAASDTIKGVRPSTTSDLSLGKDPGVDYDPKAKDEQDFVAKHSVQKFDDVNGNGADVFQAANVKHSQTAVDPHGYKKPKDKKVNEESFDEAWIVTHKDGKVTTHAGQKDAMSASKKSPGSKVSATHGAMGQRAHDVLSPHQRGDMGTFSAAGYTPPEKKKKMKEEAEELDEMPTQYRSTAGMGSKRGWASAKAAKVAFQNPHPLREPGTKKADKEFIDKAQAEFHARGGRTTQFPPGRAKGVRKEEIEQIDEISAMKGIKTAVKRQTAAYGAAIDRGDELSDREQHKVNRSQALVKKKYGEKGDKIVSKAVGKKIGYQGEEVEQVDEVLTKKDPASTWIRDFIKSKDPKFAGKSKKERQRMALGAYYAKQRNEEVELDEGGNPINKAKKNTAVAAIGAQHKDDQYLSKMRTSVANKIRGREITQGQDRKQFKESLAMPLLGGDIDDESAEMAKAQLKALAAKANALADQMSDDLMVEPWVQSKIAIAKDYVTTVHDYMIYGEHDKNNEQTGPDTPMTFPNMSVDVNTGHNV